MEVIFLNINVIGDMVVVFVICIVTFIIFRIEAVIFITFVFLYYQHELYLLLEHYLK